LATLEQAFVLVAPCQWSMWFLKMRALLHNTSEFRIEIMYDYYIVMKFTFLVENYLLTLLLTMQASSFFFHELHKQHQNYSKPKAFSKSKF
jgi:hypothetical protein